MFLSHIRREEDITSEFIQTDRFIKSFMFYYEITLLSNLLLFINYKQSRGQKLFILCYFNACLIFTFMQAVTVQILTIS